MSALTLAPGADRAAVAASRPLIRALAFAVAVAFCGVGGHLAGGGELPDPATLLLAISLAIPAHRVWLSARRPSAAALGVGLAAGQWAMHWLFTSTGPEAPLHSNLTPGPHLTHHVGAGASGSGTGGVLMLCGHLVATVILAVVLHRGEQAWWVVARLLGMRPFRLPVDLGRAAAARLIALSAGLVRVGRRARRDRAAAPRRVRLFGRTPVRRGPPAPRPGLPVAG